MIDVCSNRAAAYMKMGEYPQAKVILNFNKDCEKALEINPDFGIKT